MPQARVSFFLPHPSLRGLISTYYVVEPPVGEAAVKESAAPRARCSIRLVLDDQPGDWAKRDSWTAPPPPDLFGPSSRVPCPSVARPAPAGASACSAPAGRPSSPPQLRTWRTRSRLWPRPSAKRPPPQSAAFGAAPATKSAGRSYSTPSSWPACRGDMDAHQPGAARSHGPDAAGDHLGGGFRGRRWVSFQAPSSTVQPAGVRLPA